MAKEFFDLFANIPKAEQQKILDRITHGVQQRAWQDRKVALAVKKRKSGGPGPDLLTGAWNTMRRRGDDIADEGWRKTVVKHRQNPHHTQVQTARRRLGKRVLPFKKMSEGFVDPIEQRHKETNARIRAGAKAGKYWLVRCEGEEMFEGLASRIAKFKNRHKIPVDKLRKMGLEVAADRLEKAPVEKVKHMKFKIHESDREWLIRKILETTMSSAIGGRPMPMGINKNDPALGGRNKFNKKQLRFALADLRSMGSSK